MFITLSGSFVQIKNWFYHRYRIWQLDKILDMRNIKLSTQFDNNDSGPRSDCSCNNSQTFDKLVLSTEVGRPGSGRPRTQGPAWRWCTGCTGPQCPGPVCGGPSTPRPRRRWRRRPRTRWWPGGCGCPRKHSAAAPRILDDWWISAQSAAPPSRGHSSAADSRGNATWEHRGIFPLSSDILGGILTLF